ncbi:Reverse transcriptase (RNA-dependent DNA polymerase) [Popillia japonica]|uniref:Reverse transcriptase (RNA-dependent DNA polymerase) n=1 Tax=Popillia japonica TaxID=7064 RepID=A0AAW1HTZ6_POPJA
MPKVTVAYKNMNPVQLQSLLYADDIVLMGDKLERTQRTINQWNKIIMQKGMQINTSKTKVMTINAPKNQQDIMCGEDTLERVSTITYLGSKISDDGKVDVEILNRSKKAMQIFYQLNNIILGKKKVSAAEKYEK